ncbi:MAG: lysophospholipid acyltransferase family protein [Planctomycetota bacterium]
MKSLINWILGKTEFDVILNRTTENQHMSIFHALCEDMDLHCDSVDNALKCIPTTGPLVVIANHPTGVADASLLARAVLSVRKDVRMISHKFFTQYPNFAKYMFFVDPSTSDAENGKEMLKAIRWVKKGGALIVYPAGEISYLHRRPLKVMDPAWRPEIARLLRMTRPQVLPVFFFGRNSALFQFLAFCRPKLRKLLICREFLNKKGRTFKMRIGSVNPYSKLSHISDYTQLIDHLRKTTYNLKSIVS